MSAHKSQSPPKSSGNNLSTAYRQPLDTSQLTIAKLYCKAKFPRKQHVTVEASANTVGGTRMRCQHQAHPLHAVVLSNDRPEKVLCYLQVRALLTTTTTSSPPPPPPATGTSTSPSSPSPSSSPASSSGCPTGKCGHTTM